MTRATDVLPFNYLGYNAYTRPLPRKSQMNPDRYPNLSLANPPQADTTPPGFLHRVRAAFTAWNDARVTRNILLNLSDHELDDIGLVRADVYDLTSRGWPTE